MSDYCDMNFMRTSLAERKKAEIYFENSNYAATSLVYGRVSWSIISYGDRNSEKLLTIWNHFSLFKYWIWIQSGIKLCDHRMVTYGKNEEAKCWLHSATHARKSNLKTKRFKIGTNQLVSTRRRNPSGYHCSHNDRQWPIITDFYRFSPIFANFRRFWL